MGRRSVVRLASLAMVVATGCSLLTDLDGYSEPVADAGRPNDAAPPNDARPDAPADVAVDTTPPPPPCKPSLVVDSTFATSLDDWLPFQSALQGYPKVEAFMGAPAGVLFPKVIVPPNAGQDGGPPSPEKFSASSGLWRPEPVPLRGFDLDVDVYVDCTMSGSCADGLVIAWIDSTSTADLVNTNHGHMAGLPAMRNGAGIVLDDYKNGATEVADPPPPTLQIVQLDATKTLGEYPWQVVTTDYAFLGAWHTIHVSLRDTDVTVTADGKTLSGKVRAFPRGLFGLTAGTGGETDAVAIRNLHAKFYDCVP